MEMIINENSIKFRQNANQIWYCEGFTINCKSIFDGIAISQKAIQEINGTLVALNETEKNKEKTKTK